MGRSSGFLAMHVGLAGGAEVILVPEIEFSVDDLINRIRDRHRLKLGSIIIVAEADEPGRSFKIADEINSQLDIIYRVCVLGHTQRGGIPTLRDREIASLMGYHAIKALLDGHDQVMVAYQQEQCAIIDFHDPCMGARKLTDTTLFDINNILCDL